MDKNAAKLSLEDVARLVNWCSWQSSDLWEGMTLQDILNVYHASRDWDTFEGWTEEEGDVARIAWNKAVKDTGHHLRLMGR